MIFSSKLSILIGFILSRDDFLNSNVIFEFLHSNPLLQTRSLFLDLIDNFILIPPRDHFFSKQISLKKTFIYDWNT